MNRSQERKLMFLSAIVLFGFSVFVIQFPLLNYLGFEFSFTVALIVPWVVGYFTIKRFRLRLRDTTPFGLYGFRTIVRTSLSKGLLLVCIPFIVASLNIIFVKNCSYGEGVLYYALNPMITAVWSTSLAAFCVVMFRRSFLVYCAILTVILIHPLVVGYVSPQIYVYNFIFGFFPGITYDEVLRISPTLVVFRLITLFTAMLLFLIADSVVGYIHIKESFIRKIFALSSIVRLRFKAVFMLLSAAFLLLAWIFRVELGFGSSTSYIQQALGSSISTQHFQIYYSPKSFSEEEIKWAAALHEFRLHQVASALQVQFTGTISSYIYPDVKAKAQFIGAGQTNIAKPWRKEIHLNAEALEHTLKHELVHVLAGEFGMPIIKAHYNIALVEGLATAVDDNFGNRTLHEYAAAMKKFGIVKDPGTLIDPTQFALKASTVSYISMGSFCQYLIDHYDIARLKALYSGTSVSSVYGKAYYDLIGEWQNFLLQIDVSDEWHKHVEFYFRRPSIFAKQCARKIANLNEEAYRQLEKKSFILAMGKFSEALDEGWNTESYAGLIRTAYRLARYDTVITLVDDLSFDTAKSPSIANLFILYGDALWQRSDMLMARKAYEQILALDLSERYNEAAAIRLAVLSDSSVRMFLLDYSRESLNDSAALQRLDALQQQSTNPIISFFKGKILYRVKRYSDAVHELASIDVPLRYPILEATKEHIIGESYFMMKRFQQARMHFWYSLNSITNEASRDRVYDWLERCEWYENNVVHSATVLDESTRRPQVLKKDKIPRRDAFGKKLKRSS
ncbi:MAG: hypothetical protein HY707_08375 [Ignavibacteriae bacterium]|nr:hypothetical protein [Ignavibacteriota bacterium]